MINVDNLTKKYGSNLALNKINLDLEKGKVYGLVGENGAGKTTLINCIAKVIKNYSGKIEIENIKIGFMPQDAALEEEITAENLLLFFYLLDDEKNALENVNKSLKLTDCYDFKDKKIKELSHGMRRRVMIAQALLHDPELIILDEPTSGLDPKVVIEVRGIIKKLKSKGKTLFISSHNTQDIEDACDYLIFIEKGIIKKKEKINEYRGNSIIKLLLDKSLSKKEVELLRKIKNIKDVKINDNEVLISIKDNNLVNDTINKITKYNINFVNIRIGREIDDIFKN